ncbi:MAG: hypothetical protein L6R35_003540 [Caloplaca aegaea]|nr:MAG: hypothetical protein L6R35_003540 [Caloplaca aegaea]
MWKTFADFFTADNSTPVPDSLPSPPQPTGLHEEQDNWTEGQSNGRHSLLVVSPYTSPPHLLDLATLNPSQVYLARVLSILAPVTHAYAVISYTKAFNWETVFTALATAVRDDAFKWTEQFFYIVVFRSQVAPSTNRGHLGELDKRAHAEAMKSGGLFKYWFGTPDADGRNLATCIWRQREDAHPGSSGEGHKAAMRATINMYSEWHIERFKLVIGNNVERWNLSPWTG